MMSNKSYALIGDSLTEYNTIKEFSSGYVENYGVAGNETKDILNRIPRIDFSRFTDVIILIGINDLLRNHKKMISISQDEIINNIKLIINLIMKANASIKLHIQSLYPVAKNIKYVSENEINEVNKMINSFNSEIEKFCLTNKLNFIDVHKILVFKNQLDKRYSIDGIHINIKGYEEINNVLKKNI